VAEAAMTIVNEHPDTNVRTIYAGQVAAHCGLPVADLVAVAKRRQARVRVAVPVTRSSTRESGEVLALYALIFQWDAIAELLIEPLFADEVNLAAFRAIVAADGNADKALEIAEPAARELIERLAVSDYEVVVDLEARNLIASATRRELERIRQQRDFALGPELVRAKVLLEQLDDPGAGPAAADELLSWLDRRNEERA
jgi:DNA primase